MFVETFLLILVTLLTGFLYNSTKRPKNFPPGPKCVPLMGSVPALKAAAKEAGGKYSAFDLLAKKFNTNLLGLKLGREDVVVVLSNRLVRSCFANENFDGRPNNFFNIFRSMGKKRGITSADGEGWKANRSFILRQMARVGFGKLAMEVMVQDETAAILNLLEKLEERSIPMCEFIAPSVLNVLWHFTCGKTIGRDDPKLLKFLELFRRRAKLFDMSGGMLNYFPFLRFIAPEVTGYNLLKKINLELRQYILDMIQEHLNNWVEGIDDDVIYSYIGEMKKNEGSDLFNVDELIMVCLDLFYAGADTTSSTIDFLIFSSLRYPDKQKKVRECLDNAFGTEENIGYSDRLKVPYVEAFIAETQRLYGVIPVTGPKRVMKDTILDGYHLPQNTTLLFGIDSANMDPEVWDEPKEFRPERFLDENGKLVKSDKFFAFGLGRRRCIGEALARSANFTIFANIIRKFNLVHCDGDLKSKPIQGMTIRPPQYSVKFINRNRIIM